ncbi:ParB/RepB/Spo0J family partition protein [Microbulbifer thermotolerans]|uniref:Probable chromosome-partitioning protein ParB n=1 Tax=Microbulbifer thermotolerans TaxID=252514 RepID=A0A143HQC5_MICTH|nr:ParB/RepB/Spo0J family partition protein [Microbulbifer thermotolerans]AMX03935.1 chromosome partitioning protein ParB [Microbulbifer thermotolerans]MCX2782908.1 ParB/RepB/Spo0J family partition protein [Microbulbifer thermotolerans]MCX2801725.1 ParB/RepB/Spo0J family partition protein [Microbulbifer thermotolerans]MCX2830782.1 ParB/RepB/Spo0J family partition protein [Microbulbifer thermotolerans]MCX2840919.1 ParB/RepB/Spo0J family partition protein [Microbulbifer thermotolerans]
MAAKRKGLGRGLSHLISDNASEAIAVATGEVDAKAADGELRELPIEYLQRGRYQPRRDFPQETLQELADSIRAQGIMQPIVVRPVGELKYEIIAGERRWRAAQMAQLDRVPALVREVSDEAAIAMALIENIQREDLNPVEEAVALKRLQDEFQLTQQEVADAVGKSRTAVTNLLRLLSLTSEVRTFLERGDLELGHAKALLGLAGETQRAAARQVVERGLTVRQTEALVRRLQQQVQKPAPAKQKEDPNIRRLSERLAEKIGVPVAIDHNEKGVGKLVLKYNSLDELDGILAHLGYSED